MQPSWSRIVIVAAAVAVVATASAYAAPAGARVVDKTYSCRTWHQHPVYFGTQVRLPPGGQVAAQPAQASVTTARNHAFQVVFKDVKNSLRVDKSVCRPSSRRVPLKPAGLALDQTVTRNVTGYINGYCPTHATRVLVHFWITMTAGTPQQALLAVRKDDAKHRPLAFFKWTPRRVTGYLAGSCTTYS
jgi:hypothetical protein